MNLTPALTDLQGSAPAVRFGAHAKQLASATLLAVSLNLPAFAEKIEAIGQAKKEHPANQTLLAIFSGLNIVAGVAILATIIFGVIWFLQRRDEDDEEEDEEEDELEEDLAKKSEEKSEERAAEAPKTESSSEAAGVDEAADKADDSEDTASKIEDADK